MTLLGAGRAAALVHLHMLNPAATGKRFYAAFSFCDAHTNGTNSFGSISAARGGSERSRSVPTSESSEAVSGLSEVLGLMIVCEFEELSVCGWTTRRETFARTDRLATKR